MTQGYDFVWHAKSRPYFIKPDVYLTVRDDVPYYDVWDSESSKARPAKTKP